MRKNDEFIRIKYCPIDKMTESAHLIFDIVLSHDEAFDSDLSKEQILGLILYHKEALTYPNIWRMYCKHYAYYLYNKLHEAIKLFVKNKNKKEEFENEKNEILRELWEDADDVLWDCFEKLIIAEYKEYVYNCDSKHYRYFGADYYDEMCEYAKFMNMFDVDNYVHDTGHFMFNDKARIYYFYEDPEYFIE